MRTRFLTSAPNVGAFPDTTLTEIAFAGRSNVGKSSLLNRLAQARIARTSRTPGRTQAVNFFEVGRADGDIILADLPGYGYARAPKVLRREWYGLIEAYLGQREQLRAVLQLVDIRRGVQDEEKEVHRWLTADTSAKVFVVATKGDKIPKAKRKPVLSQVARDLGIPSDRVLYTSASSGDGIEDLRKMLFALSVNSGDRR